MLTTFAVSSHSALNRRLSAGTGLLRLALTSVALACVGIPALHAQAVATLEGSIQPALSVATLAVPSPPAALPDAPDAQARVSAGTSSSSASSIFAAPATTMPADAAFQGSTMRPAGRYATVIQPGQTAPALGVKGKIVESFKSSVTVTALAGWVISAGYEQAVNGSPNFPQTGKGFAQRLGAASARATSETVFGNGVIASVVHEDPRYYRMGPNHNFFKRTAYSITRPLITRTDGGRTTFNIWDLGGDLSGAALTPVYYPQLNRNGTDVLRTFGGSVGGDALGFFVSEFLPDVLTGLHLRHQQ